MQQDRVTRDVEPREPVCVWGGAELGGRGNEGLEQDDLEQALGELTDLRSSVKDTRCLAFF
jgi:hypothetical protein